jgi:hypothetical protein
LNLSFPASVHAPVIRSRFKTSRLLIGADVSQPAIRYGFNQFDTAISAIYIMFTTVDDCETHAGNDLVAECAPAAFPDPESGTRRPIF